MDVLNSTLPSGAGLCGLDAVDDAGAPQAGRS